MNARSLLLCLLASILAVTAAAQTPNPPYGAPIGHADAKKVMAASLAEATRNNWNVAIAIVDSGGHLVLFERMENVQFASVDISQGKAATSVAFRRASKSFQDTVAAGGEGLRTLGIPGVTPLEGGVPIIVGGKVIGAVGVSGVTSAQDAQIAQAGATALGN